MSSPSSSSAAGAAGAASSSSSVAPPVVGSSAADYEPDDNGHFASLDDLRGAIGSLHQEMLSNLASLHDNEIHHALNMQRDTLVSEYSRCLNMRVDGTGMFVFDDPQTGKLVKGVEAIQCAEFVMLSRIDNMAKNLSMLDERCRPLEQMIVQEQETKGSVQLQSDEPLDATRLVQIMGFVTNAARMLRGWQLAHMFTDSQLFNQGPITDRVMPWYDGCASLQIMCSREAMRDSRVLLEMHIKRQLMYYNYHLLGDEIHTEVLLSKTRRAIVIDDEGRSDYVCDDCGRTRDGHHKFQEHGGRRVPHAFRYRLLPVDAPPIHTMAYEPVTNPVTQKALTLLEFARKVCNPTDDFSMWRKSRSRQNLEQAVHNILMDPREHGIPHLKTTWAWAFNDGIFYQGDFYPFECMCHEYANPDLAMPWGKDVTDWLQPDGTLVWIMGDDISNGLLRDDGRPRHCSKCKAGFCPIRNRGECPMKFFRGVYFNYEDRLHELRGKETTAWTSAKQRFRELLQEHSEEDLGDDFFEEDVPTEVHTAASAVLLGGGLSQDRFSCANCGMYAGHRCHVPACTFMPDEMDWTRCRFCWKPASDPCHKPQCRLQCYAPRFEGQEATHDSRCHDCGGTFADCECVSFNPFGRSLEAVKNLHKSTPYWNSIFECQGISRDVIDTAYTLFGRTFHGRVGLHDNWQCLLFILGPQQNGKSTLLNGYESFWPSSEVAYISDVSQTQFAWELLAPDNRPTPAVLMCKEVTEKFRPAATDLQLIADHGHFHVIRKGKTPRDIKHVRTFFVAAGNAVFGGMNAPLGRRTLTIKLNNTVPENRLDGALERRMRMESGALLLRSYLIYKDVNERLHPNKAILSIVPEYFLTQIKSIVARAQPVYAFLRQLPEITATRGDMDKSWQLTEPGEPNRLSYYVPLASLKHAFMRFKRANYPPNEKIVWNEDLYEEAFKRHKIRIVEDERDWDDGENPIARKRGKWVLGIMPDQANRSAQAADPVPYVVEDNDKDDAASNNDEDASDDDEMDAGGAVAELSNMIDTMPERLVRKMLQYARKLR